MIFSKARAEAKRAVLFLVSAAVVLVSGATAVQGQFALDGFNPKANGPVRVVVVQPDGKVLIGGDFTTLSPNGGAQVTRNRIARLNANGTLDTAFNPNADNIVFAVALQADGKVLVGGLLGNVGGATRNRMARLDATTGLADSFNPNANSPVLAITVQADGKILVGGGFNGANSIGGQARNHIARLDATSGMADSFDPNANAAVRAIVVQADGKILAGGDFNGIGGQTRNHMARLNAATGVADSFDPNANDIVRSIAVQADGKILAGGDFAFGPSSIGGQPRDYIARLDSTTGLADSFNPTAGNSVYAVAVQTDGKILAGGAFTGIGGQTRNYIARLEATTGAADSFDPNANSNVNAIAVQADGGIVLGGDFTTFGSNTRNRVGRIVPLCPGSIIFAENFDGVVVPALPAGWVATNIQTGNSPLWTTSTGNPDTAPNSAFVGNLNEISDKRLDTPPIAIGGVTAQLSFRNNYNFEYNPPPNETFWDGGVLEISSPNINGGAFTDITDPAVGGSFVTGGYTGVIDASGGMNPLAGQMAWGGNSGGYINSIVNLGPNVSGQTIKLRFRMGEDSNIGAPGWRVDTISITGMDVCPTATPILFGNISTRLRVETGDNVLIGGFIITGTQPKKIIVRAIGPSLPVAGALDNPILELRNSSGGLILSNDNWRTGGQEAEIIATTIPPGNDLESAIVTTLPANNSAYTAIVRGVNNGTGIGVVEAYDLDRTVNSKLGNISTRGLVQTGANVMIGGLIVLGQNPLRVIVRAIGPSLPVPGALGDPTLELFDGNGSLIASNDNWRTGGQEGEIIATGIPPSNDFESAIVRNLNPGAYTVIVRGVNSTTGVAVVDAYGLN